ncbi:MAG: methyltransferase domain-containing protein [Coleofasciculaceae cyanobacterium]
MSKLIIEKYPLSANYDPQWVRTNEMGPNALWLTEALTQVMDIKSGMRILDLGCGTAMSSIFLAKEFNVQVWATDLWISATENYARICEAGVEDRVFPIHAEARSLPYADDFFDAIVSLDSFHYFGTDVHYLEFYLLNLLKKGGQIGIVSPASPQPIPNPPPLHLGKEWYWLKSLEWWQEHWSRNPDLEVTHAEMLPKGWELWVRWHEFIFSGEPINQHNTEEERKQIIADSGNYLGFVRMVASKKDF